MLNMDLKIDYIFNTKRNKRCISIENYIFSESNHLKNGSFRFRCTNRTCTESVLVNSTIDKILSFSNNNIHNHEPTTDHNLAVRCVRTAVKRKAEEDLHARPNKIIRKEIQDTNPVFMEVIVHNDIKLLRESAYRIRKKHFPKIPTTINEAFDQLFETQVDIKTNNEQFCFVNREKQIILFTCTENLKHLCESENVFGDGTFNYAPNYFYQLYTIHIFRHNYYIPVVYAFLTSKSEDQYISMWLEIKK